MSQKIGAPTRSPLFSIEIESAVWDGEISTVADVLSMPQAADGIVWGRVTNSKATQVEKTEQDWIDEGETANSYNKYQPDKGVQGATIGWCGGVMDYVHPKYGRFLMFAQGGHQAYGGNEGYALEFGDYTNPQSPTLDIQWRRLLDPAGLNSRMEYAEYLDGTPCARHTYFYAVHDPVRNLMVLPSGNTWFNQELENPPDQNGSFFYYPMDSLSGDPKADTQHWVRRYPADVLNYTEGFAFWHPRNAMIYIPANKSPRFMIDPTSDEWVSTTGSASKDNRSAPAYFSALDAVWAAGRHDKGTNPKLCVKQWDMSQWDTNGSAPWQYVDLTGDEMRVLGADSGGTTTMVPFPSTCEDTEFGRYVYWRPFFSDVNYESEDPGYTEKVKSTNDFWLIGQDKVSRKVSTASSSPFQLPNVYKNQSGDRYSSEHYDGGGYTRMFYHQELNRLVWVQSMNSDVYIGRLPKPLSDGSA